MTVNSIMKRAGRHVMRMRMLVIRKDFAGASGQAPRAVEIMETLKQCAEGSASLAEPVQNLCRLAALLAEAFDGEPEEAMEALDAYQMALNKLREGGPSKLEPLTAWLEL